MDLELLLARFSVGQVSEDELISAAVEALESGLDGQALRELAGVIPVERDRARPLFELAVQELGLRVPEVADAVRLFAHHIAREAMTGGRDLMEASCALGDLGLSYGMQDRSLAIWPGAEVNLYVFDHICDSQRWPADERPSPDRLTAWIREEMEKVLRAT
jgi:hypothetical protein